MRFDYGLPTVFISDYDLAVEAYSGDALLGRPTKLLPGYAVLRGKVGNEQIHQICHLDRLKYQTHNPSITLQESSGEITGVTFSQGRTWHEGRKFMLQHVNNFVTKVHIIDEYDKSEHNWEECYVSRAAVELSSRI